MKHERIDIIGERLSVKEAIDHVEAAIHWAQDFSRGDLFDEYSPGKFPIPGGGTGKVTDSRRVTEYGDTYRVDVYKSSKKPTSIEILAPRDHERYHMKFIKGEKEWKYGSDEEPPKFVLKTLARLGLGSTQ